MDKSKVKKAAYVEMEGQLSIWDFEIAKKPHGYTEILNEITPIENEKPIKLLELTDMQHEFLKNNNVIGSDNLSRIIKYCGGGVGIEIKQGDGFRTIYINENGKEEFESNKKSVVLPMDKIVYYSEELKVNELQENNLKDILETMKSEVKRVIHRKGDENILIELKDKVISLIPIGWKLDFNIKDVYCNEDEILSVESKKDDIEEMQQSIKVGDIVKAYYGKEVVIGEICRVYGPGDTTLNIIFDNKTKHTAICRSCVISLIEG